MGNRAAVVFASEGHDGKTELSPVVYLHWNGGPESIYAFLAEFTRRGYGHCHTSDAARFVQIVGEFFDSGDFGRGGTSLGIEPGPKSLNLKTLSKSWGDWDNGLYVVQTGFRYSTREENRNMQVRRFDIEKGPDGEWRAVELSAADVAAERATAEADPKYAALVQWGVASDAGLKATNIAA